MGFLWVGGGRWDIILSGWGGGGCVAVGGGEWRWGAMFDNAHYI